MFRLIFCSCIEFPNFIILDRVVDKLNPTQVFTKQDVLSLMEYSNDELPRVDFDNVEEEFSDPVLIDVCKVGLKMH